MSVFKLSLLLFSSASFHLSLTRTPSPDAEDKIMVKTTREQVWRHAGVPSDIFLKVSSFSRYARPRLYLLIQSGHDIAGYRSGVIDYH